MDVTQMKQAQFSGPIDRTQEGKSILYVWYGEANGVGVAFTTEDRTVGPFYVCPILTMRERGVALVDADGNMIVNERVPR